MAYNRLLKMDITLLVIVVLSIMVSLYALSIGNLKFIGILGIALLALVLIVWRILSLMKSAGSSQEKIDIDFDADLLKMIRPPMK